MFNGVDKIVIGGILLSLVIACGNYEPEKKSVCNYKVGDVVQTYTGGHVTQVLKVSKNGGKCIYKVRTIDLRARWIYDFEVQSIKE